MMQSCDDILEPKVHDLINQLREIGNSSIDWLADHLLSRLSSLSAPDDLFNLFKEMRGQFGSFVFMYCYSFLSAFA